eukprot:m.49375 g.49375  ORF g.49375 m.49375 type:complete len:401 (+) comp7113_c0_seq1:195-1397(+)
MTLSLPLLYAIIGGASMGVYPAFIKTKAVLAADVHPSVFQLYKSSMVFLTGFLFLIPRYLRKAPDDPLFVFSYWGIVSAFCWVPSGISTITAVPRIGMGLTMLISAGTGSVLSFLVFWLVFNSKMKSYSCGPQCSYYRAPIYLAIIVAGMGFMIFAERIADWWCGTSVVTADEKDNFDAEEEQPLIGTSREAINSTGNKNKRTDSGNNVSARDAVIGSLSGMSSGFFGAMQYGVMTEGKALEEIKDHCKANTTACPKDLVEQFDSFGSWMVSFGIGALVAALMFYAMVSLIPGLNLRGPRPWWPPAPPSLHWNTLRTAGVAAGLFWVIGNFFVTLAVVAGGNAVVLAQEQSTTVIVSTSLGILYYREGGNVASRVIWLAAAAITLAALVLLGLEKAASKH